MGRQAATSSEELIDFLLKKPEFLQVQAAGQHGLINSRPELSTPSSQIAITD